MINPTQRARLLLAASLLLALGCDDAPSAPSDAGARLLCRAPAECSDGVFCNGVEACSPGAPGADARGCLAATNPCGEQLRCNETARQCQSTCEGPPDADGDGHAAVVCGGDDCDDSDADRFPGNVEVCDEGPRARHDEDCDPMTLGLRDQDGDGDVDSACCNPSAAGELCGPDCDDTSPRRRSGHVELCDSVDNDCDGRVDEDTQDVLWYPDADGDGFGAAAGAVLSCTPVAASSLMGSDCDDTEAQVHPGLRDICDAVDTDCNGAIDDDALCAESTLVPSAGATLSLTTAAGVRIVVEVPAGAVPVGTLVALGESSSTSLGGLLDAGSVEGVPFALSPLDLSFAVPLRVTVTTAGVAPQVFVSTSLEGGTWAALPIARSGGVLAFSTHHGGVFAVLRPACVPSVEVCDGLDNDCDGMADDGGVCSDDGLWRPDPVACPTADASAEEVYRVVALNVPSAPELAAGTEAGHDLDASGSVCGAADFASHVDNALYGLSDALSALSPWGRLPLRRAFTEAVACPDGEAACQPLRILVRLRPGIGCAELRLEDALSGDELALPFGVSVDHQGHFAGAVERLSMSLPIRTASAFVHAPIELGRVILTGALGEGEIRELTLGGVWDGADADLTLRALAPAVFVDGEADADAVSAALASRLDIETAAGACAGLSVGLVGRALPVSEVLCLPGEFEQSPPTPSAPRVCQPCALGTFSDALNAGACRSPGSCADGTVVTRAASARRDRACGVFQWVRAVDAGAAHAEDAAAGPYLFASGVVAGAVGAGAQGVDIGRVDAQGAPLSTWTFAGALADELECVATGAGGLACGGYFVALGQPPLFPAHDEGLVRSFDNTGTDLWSATLKHGLADPFSAQTDDRVRGLAAGVNAGSDVVVAVGTAGGALDQGGNDSPHYFARMFGASGQVLWTHEGSGAQTPTCAVVDPSGGVVLAGQSPTGFSTAFVRRLGPDGTLLWAASFGPLGASIEVTDVAVADGAIYVVGRIAGAFPGYTSAGGFDSFLVRLHPDDGALVWAQQWGSAGDDTARALAVRGDGRVFVLGDAPVAAAGVQAFGGVDAFVLQSDATGQVATLHALGTALADRAYGLDFDEGGDLLVMLATFGMLQGSGSAASGHVFARLPTLEFP